MNVIEPKLVLWTGGWDSTFRIIQLVKRGLVLQPLYVKDHGRPSTTKEIETIRLLSKEIENRFHSTGGKILPLKFVNRRDIKTDLYLKLIFKLLRKKRSVGKQYYWLACLSKKYKGLELGIHGEDRGQLIDIDELVEIKDGNIGKNWIANPKKMDFLRFQLFKNVRFPIAYISKLEMKAYAEKNGFIDIMEKTWFCHKSGNRPCGKCNPCKQYVIDGFGYRLDAS